ncbi:MAG TPA: ATP-binding protein [Steroidobacteraceae bacterium]|nr:ATP-binding protein [Steroidobacteraceae bacterium]
MRRYTSEMRLRFKEFDWSKTSIGPVERWPLTWQNVVNLLLASSFPSAVGLGPELLYIYNDAFIALGGRARHPAALGRPVREIWSEIWEPVLERRFSETLATGRPTGEADLLMPLLRSGYLEETYITFSFAALADDYGHPSGIFCTATENTGLVIARRQLDCLRRLASHCACAESPEAACHLAAQALEGQRRDIPFAIFYLLDSTGSRIESIASTGLGSIPVGVPGPGHLEQAVDPWQLAKAVSGRTPLLIESVADMIGPALVSPEVIPQQALAIPFADAGADAPKCILVTGLNPMRPAEESRRFFELVAGQVATAISSARMRENAERRARELATLDRAKTVFFSNVSHELRTPLTLLLEPLRHVLDCAQLDAGDRQLLLTARRAGTRLLKLVNSLLEFSRIEGGRIDARYLPTDLGLFTADLASMFRSAFERAGLQLMIDCASMPEQAYVDRDMWEKVVLNLVSNALKFTLAGQVSIRVRACDDCFELQVADTGCGIAAEDLPRIFDRFATIEAPRARSAERTGIGLSLVKERVKLHGGTIEAESDLGVGTTMSVRIPRGRSHLPQDRIAAHTSSQHEEGATQPYLEEALGWLAEEFDSTSMTHAEHRSPERILLVDDNADMRNYLLRLLQERWQVEMASDGAAALERVHHQPPDLVIADIMMPQVDGLELLRRMRSDSATSQIPVLLLSARAGEEASAGGLRAGADDYLVKPFSRHELLARIESRLATARQHAAERQARMQAEQTIKAREEFFAALAHELRGPAACLFTWIERLRDQGLDDGEGSGALDVLETAAHSVRRLAEDLLDVARGTSGRMRVDRQRYESLAPLIAAVLEAYGPAASQKDIILRGKLEDDSGPVEVDADRIQQIVSNLLSNAIRFTPTGGHIEVRCGRCADDVEVRVCDSGRGIPADALPHVFERYWQGAPALDGDSGLGLGLAICQRLVELHDGHIEAMSEGRDRGATFIVRLPLAAGAVDKRKRRRNFAVHTRIRDAALNAARLAGRQVTRPFRTES